MKELRHGCRSSWVKLVMSPLTEKSNKQRRRNHNNCDQESRIYHLYGVHLCYSFVATATIDRTAIMIAHNSQIKMAILSPLLPSLISLKGIGNSEPIAILSNSELIFSRCLSFRLMKNSHTLSMTRLSFCRIHIILSLRKNTAHPGRGVTRAGWGLLPRRGGE